MKINFKYIFLLTNTVNDLEPIKNLLNNCEEISFYEFISCSNCNPALLNHPILQYACDYRNKKHKSFLLSDNTGLFRVIKEQAQTFSDSIKPLD